MRVRKMKNSDERFSRAGEGLLTDDPLRDLPLRKNAPDRMLCAEIGCGKGKFIAGTAASSPERDFIALEKISDVITLAMERFKEDGSALPENLRFVCADVSELQKLLPPGSLDVIYLNFSDPWPKARHEKRRLTYHEYLGLYRSLLREGGKVIMKTDNRGLFDYSLESFASNGWEVSELTFDLHHSEWNEGNITTEYEDNFSAKGFPICRGVFSPVGAVGADAPEPRITSLGIRP